MAEPPTPEPPTTRRVPRWVAVAGLAVLVALAGAGAFVWLGDGSDDDAAEEEPLSLEEGVLDQTTAEMADLANAGTRGTYHAGYEQSDGVTMELWRRVDDARVDLVSPEGHEVTVLRVDGATTRCDRDGDWVCERTPASDGEGGAEGIARPDFAQRLVEDLQGSELSVVDGEIAQTPVRCFSSLPSAETTDDAIELCFTAEGVMARVATGGEHLELVELEMGEVADEVFEPPAEPES